MDYDELQTATRKLNRANRLRPKAGLFWCGICDRDVVADGGKCPTCGNRNGRRRLKAHRH